MFLLLWTCLSIKENEDELNKKCEVLLQVQREVQLSWIHSVLMISFSFLLLLSMLSMLINFVSESRLILNACDVFELKVEVTFLSRIKASMKLNFKLKLSWSKKIFCKINSINFIMFDSFLNLNVIIFSSANTFLMFFWILMYMSLSKKDCCLKVKECDLLFIVTWANWDALSRMLVIDDVF